MTEQRDEARAQEDQGPRGGDRDRPRSDDRDRPRGGDRDRPRGDDRDRPRGGDRGGDRDSRGGDSRGGRRPPRRFRRGKVCGFCVGKVQYVDYKDLERLRRYVTDRGKILPRRITGNCARHQRMLCTAIKRARSIALIPYKVK